MEKYCRFLQDVFNGDELIWEKDKEYKVIFEDNDVYQFDNGTGIDKKSKGHYFKVVTIE